MTIVNFSHPLTEDQKEQIRQMGFNTEQILDVRVQLSLTAPLVPQIMEIMGRVPNEEEMLVVPPGLSIATAAILAIFANHRGRLPSVVQIAPVPGVTPPKYQVAEVIDLSTL